MRKLYITFRIGMLKLRYFLDFCFFLPDQCDIFFHCGLIFQLIFQRIFLKGYNKLAMSQKLIVPFLIFEIFLDEKLVR